MKISRRLISLLLAVLMIISAVPVFASAADNTKTAKVKIAYKQILKKYSEKEETYKYTYALYDIDKNGVPELIIHFGDFEFERQYFVYTYTTKAKKLGTLSATHSELFKSSDDYMCAFYSSVGGMRINKVYIKDGKLKTKIFYDGEYKESVFNKYCPQKKLISFSAIDKYTALNKLSVKKSPADNKLTTNVKTAYRKVLKKYPVKKGEYCGNEYAVYDMNKDGVPELIIKKGVCEADRKFIVYTYNKKAVKVGLFYAGNSGTIYKKSGKGIYDVSGHMGYLNVSQITISGSKLKEKSVYDGVHKDSVFKKYAKSSNEIMFEKRTNTVLVDALTAKKK